MSVDPEIYLDCPHCDVRLSVSQQQAGNKILCPKCGLKIDSPRGDSSDSGTDTDWMLDGITDREQEPDIPETLKIDGISNSDDELAWDITCHICDSMLLVNQQQVGTRVRCNDCHSLLKVEPPKEQKKAAQSKKPSPSVAKRSSSDDDLLELAPAVELPTEYTAAQTASLLDEIPDADAKPQMASIADPAAMAAAAATPLGGKRQQSKDDDSDEMIELLDVPAAELNRNRDAALATAGGDVDEAPVRVYAKRRAKKKKQSAKPSAQSDSEAKETDPNEFPAMELGKVIDRSVAVLQSGAVLTWAAGATILMAFGSAFWHWTGAAHLDPETSSILDRIFQSGVGLVFGHGIFFLGYLVLLYVGGVIFRETANGQPKVTSVSSANGADFRSTLLLFGFSLLVAASPWLMIGWMFLTIPFQFLLAGIFLFSAWNNQSPFRIVSERLFDSFSLHGDDWKRWAISTLIAAFAGIIGGALMEVSIPALSIFTSIAGAILITIATLFYAAATGWHCGSLVHQMRDSGE